MDAIAGRNQVETLAEWQLRNVLGEELELRSDCC